MTKAAKYYPKGGRCAGCADRLADCSKLPFHTMKVHRRDGVDVAVICDRYRPAGEGEEVGRPFWKGTTKARP